MSKLVAFAAIQGGYNIVSKVEGLYKRALETHDASTKVGFPNTAYYLPFAFGMTGRKVETLGELVPVLDHARSLLHPLPSDQNWTPYLGETLDSGMATLFAAETIEAIWRTLAFWFGPKIYCGIVAFAYLFGNWMNRPMASGG